MRTLLLRVRATGREDDGLTVNELSVAIRAFGGTSPIELVPVVIGPGYLAERAAGTAIRSTVFRAFNEGVLLFVDMWGKDSPGTRPSIGEELVAEALKDGAADRMEGSVVCLLVRELPTIADEMHGVLSEPALAPDLFLLALDGQQDGNADLPEDSEAFFAALVQRPKSIDEFVLRRRGVFRSLGAEPRPNYYVFQYDFLPDGEREIVAAFRAFLEAKRTDLVLYDASNTSDWFGSWLLRAASDADITCIDVHDLVPATARTVAGSQPVISDRVAERLNDDNSVVALIAGSIDSGGTFGRMLDRLTPGQRAKTRLLAVFGNTSRSSARPYLDGRTGGVSKFKLEKMYAAEYLVGVPFRQLPDRDWKVAAAIRLGEVIETHPGDGSYHRQNSLAVTKTAIWSLLEDLGVIEEENVPGGRAGVLYFPDLKKLEPEDAHWIAEAVVERILTVSDRVRGSLVFVLPDQDTGAARLAPALRELCDVEVLQGTIEKKGLASFSTADKSRIEMLRAGYFVAFDESAVTYGTLGALDNGIATARRRGVEHYAVVVDFGESAARPDPFYSLISWRPLGREPLGVSA